MRKSKPVNVCNGCLVIGTDLFRNELEPCPKCHSRKFLFYGVYARWINEGKYLKESTWGKGRWEFNDKEKELEYLKRLEI